MFGMLLFSLDIISVRHPMNLCKMAPIFSTMLKDEVLKNRNIEILPCINTIDYCNKIIECINLQLPVDVLNVRKNYLINNLFYALKIFQKEVCFLFWK